MKHWLRLSLFVLLIAAAAGSTCYFVVRLFPRQESARAVDYHYWIHAKLGLSPEQEKSLEPIEEKFTANRKDLIARIREGNRELADAIISDRSDSERVKAAVDKIHRAQGDLQNAVLEHVFAMRPILSDAQYERLTKMTAEALRDAPELQ
ncbi:MAG: Spy/CpxP family protein refolding chaperone [Chthoniobacterales bacterium]